MGPVDLQPLYLLWLLSCEVLYIRIFSELQVNIQKRLTLASSIDLFTFLSFLLALALFSVIFLHC